MSPVAVQPSSVCGAAVAVFAHDLAVVRDEHDEHEEGRREQPVDQCGEDEELDRVDAEESEECAAEGAETDEHVEERRVRGTSGRSPMACGGATTSADAPEPARTGMASMPEPMNPSANRVSAIPPAAGLRACAACAALVIVVLPLAPIVAPVETMIANMTRFENAIPVKSSSRLVRSFSFGRRRFVERLGPGAAFVVGA